jgi:hypothetical protein
VKRRLLDADGDAAKPSRRRLVGQQVVREYGVQVQDRVARILFDIA